MFVCIRIHQARSQPVCAATLLRRRYADSRSPSANAYIALLNKHFPEPAADADASAPAVEYSSFDVLAFYSGTAGRTRL
jgi:hypothetical protein